MTIIHEPEGFIFGLPGNDEVVVEASSRKENVLLKVSMDSNRIVIGVWDDDHSYRVLHKGADVFAKYLD